MSKHGNGLICTYLGASVVFLLLASCATVKNADNPPTQVTDPARPEYANKVESALQSKKTEIAKCIYKDTPSGRVVVVFEITATGIVGKNYIGSTQIKFPKTEICLLKVIQSLNFDPPPKGKTIISYPFNVNNNSSQSAAIQPKL